jgi:hypothetical protein
MCICMHTNPWIGRNVHIWAPIQIWNSKSESRQNLENWVSGRGPSARGPRTVRSIRNWTVRSAVQKVWMHQDVDRPPPLRGPSATGSKAGQRQQTCHFCSLHLLSRSPLAKTVTFVDCARTEKRSYARTVRQLVEKFNQHVVITVFRNLMDFIKSLQFWDYSGFLFHLELSNSFTNLIGGIVSATHYECCAKIWTRLDGYFLRNRHFNDWGD